MVQVRAWVIHLRSLWWIVLIALSVSVVTGAGVALERHLHPTVYVAGLRFDASRADEVRLALSALQNRPITLRTLHGESWQTTPTALGVRIDIDKAIEQAWKALELPFGARLGMLVDESSTFEIHIPLSADVDPDRLYAALIALAPDLEREPVNARLYVQPEGTVIEPHQVGYRPDIKATRTQILRASMSRNDRTAHVILESIPPSIAADDLTNIEPLWLLSEFTTTYDDGPENTGRATNIQLAVERINGAVLRPGDMFSLNEETGPRTEADGYQVAPVIIDGELVPGIGGGVSQVTSTIFNAALLAGMEVVEYHSHSRPVSYVPLGRDATVWYGALDLRFRNTWDDLVIVQGSAGDGVLSFKLWSPSPPDRRTVTVRTETLEFYAAPVEERIDPSLAPGERVIETAGRDGRRIAIYQTVYENGAVIARRTLYATYRTSPEVVRVGPGETPTLGQ